MPGKEATCFRVEVVDDGRAPVNSKVVRIGRDFQLLAEDIMGEVGDCGRLGEGIGALPGAGGEEGGGVGPGKVWRPE